MLKKSFSLIIIFLIATTVFTFSQERTAKIFFVNLFNVKIRVEDKDWNSATRYSGKITFNIDGRKVGSCEIITGDLPAGVVKNLTISEPGTYYIEALDEENNIKGISNPIRVQNNAKQNIYWGELHGHTAYTDGTGTPDQYFSYARDIAFLDFCYLFFGYHS